VTVETIDVVNPIPNADRIEMATLKGKDFQFVIAKGSFAPSDRCLYFPVDSIVPSDLIEKMGLTGKLSGKNKDRVKTVKLRGQISQGLVAKLDIIPDTAINMIPTMSPEAFTALIGVTKYDPPEIPCNDGILKPLPDGQSMYDIEGADRYTEIAERLMNEPVFITEKLEGTNFSIQVKTGLTDAYQSVFVSSRRNTIIEKPDVENSFWKAARRQKLIEFAKTLCETSGKDVVVYGELIGPGIQKNIYGLKEQEVRIFDIKRGGKWVEPNLMVKLVLAFFDVDGMRERPIPIVPYIFSGNLRDFLKGKTIKQASDGPSFLKADQKREGIVIRPQAESEVEGFGRLILKQRSPEYLSESDT